MEDLENFRNTLDEDVCCLALFIMAHGNLGHIHVFDGQIELQRIFEMFDNRGCPALRGNPKLFVIQACRGGLSLTTQKCYFLIILLLEQWSVNCFYDMLLFSFILEVQQCAKHPCLDASDLSGVQQERLWPLESDCFFVYAVCPGAYFWGYETIKNYHVNSLSDINLADALKVYLTSLFYLSLSTTGYLAIHYPDTGSPLFEEMNNVFSNSGSYSMYELFTMVSTTSNGSISVLQ